MSLITLKNDSQQSPWSFRNYFRDPIILPPKSSVSLHSCVVYKGEEVDTEGSNTGMVMVGDLDSGLNPPYSFTLPLNLTGGTTFTPNTIAEAIKDSVNGVMGQPAFADNLNGSETFNAVFNATTKKILPTFTQKALPPTALNYNNPFGNSNLLYFLGTTIGAGKTRVSRNANPYAPAPGQPEPVCSAVWGQSVPRNGGVMLFQPRINALGQYSPGNSFALGMTSVGGGDEGSYATINDTAPVGCLRIRSYGPGGATPSRVVIEENVGDLETANYQPILPSSVTTLDPARVYTFAFYWDGPYSLAIKYSTNYATAYNNPANVWTELYSMKGATPPRSVPTFYDNLSAIVRMENTNDIVECFGTLSTTSGYWDWETDGDIIGRNDPLMELQSSVVFTDTLEGTFPNQFLHKEINILNDTEADDFPAQQNEWENGAIVYETELGKLIGWSKGDEASLLFKLATTGQYQNYDAVPAGTVSNTNILPTLHIQLTNFGIESKNGVVSNNVKDIAVIPQFNENLEDLSSLQHLYYQSGYENRINLNNLQQITLNQIDCRLTYDDNTDASALEDFTTLILKFHKGKED